MEAPLVLFSDGHLLAVNKRAGLPVQPDRTGDASLLDLLRADHGPGIHLTHRVDRPVSGVVLFARNAEALAACNTLFREHRVQKTYWAIVEGRCESDAEWHHHLIEDPRARKARIAEGGTGGNEAITHMKVLAGGNRYTLIELRPRQGRFHQLRAQCSAAGHPIKGDVKYGARRGEPDRAIALPARSIAFKHPVTGDALVIAAAPPSSGLWNALLHIAGIVRVERP